MTEEKNCYNCGNKNCNVYYSTVKKDYKRHFETYEYKDFDCVNHNKWEELRMEEIHTDNTKTLQNALDRIEELEKVEKQLRKENAELKKQQFSLRNERNTFLAQNEQYEKDLIDFNENLTKAKEIMNIAIEGIKHWGIVGGTERPFEKQAEKLFNLFLDKAEQFLSEVVK